MKFSKILCLPLLLGVVSASNAQNTHPKLIVNIVVSQMRYDYLQHFGKNLTERGFMKFMNESAVFTDAHYNFMQTITPTTLATLTTGADPSIHGIVSDRWIDYTTNQTVILPDDRDAWGLDCDAGLGKYSCLNLTVPTLGDRLKESDPKNKVITIAPNPVSAVVMGGHLSDVYWMDDSRGNWVSSSSYMSGLPAWVQVYNARRAANQYLDYKWTLFLPRASYVNSIYSEFDLESGNELTRFIPSLNLAGRKNNYNNYSKILYTPAGNTLVTEFVRQAIEHEQLGADEHTDLLNVCYDSPRFIGELYGGESMEVEDMFYRLDEEIGNILAFIGSRADMDRTVIVLTSDHGASDSFDYGRTPRERFNTAQFKVIVNSFMIAQYGQGDWVLDYFDRQIYLNRNLIYQKGLSLEEVQNRVAAFVLQFRGVANVLTSTAMQSSYFGGSYAAKMQNSFYPKRSGDLTINLMPGWIEEAEGKRAASGSMYEYDTHVPLMMMGSMIKPGKVIRTVNMRDVAPTLARLMRISRPIASEGSVMEEVAGSFEGEGIE